LQEITDIAFSAKIFEKVLNIKLNENSWCGVGGNAA
jgi:hypothetical protein